MRLAWIRRAGPSRPGAGRIAPGSTRWLLVLIGGYLSACLARNTAPDAEVISISLACPEAEVAAYREAAAAFRQENPLLEVQVVPVEEIVHFPLDEMDVLGPVRSLASRADVFAWTDDGVAAGPAGLLLDLAPFIGSAGGMGETAFLPGLMDRFRHEGTWAIPASVSAPLILYDPGAFDDAGLAHPQPGWGWGDFLSAATRLTRREGARTVRYGAYLGIEPVYGVVAAQGGKLVDETHGVQRAALADPRTVQAVQWYVDLVREAGVVWDPGPEEQVSPLDLLEEGRVAMSVIPSGLLGREHVEAGLRAVPLPGHSRICPQGYYVSAGTAHPDAAWRLVQFLSQEVAPPSGLPARLGQAPGSGDAGVAGAERLAAVRYATEHTLPPVRPSVVEKRLYEATRKVLGGAGAQAALDAAQELASASLEMDETGSGAVPVVTPTPQAAGEQITFLVDTGSSYRALARLFEEEHPEIEVRVVGYVDTDLGLGPVLPGLPGLIAATSADCLRWYGGAAQDAETRDAILKLQPLVDADPAFPMADYMPQALDGVRYEGELWGIPSDVQARVLYYHRALFDGAGVAYPGGSWTWEDLFQAARQLAGEQEGQRIYGFALPVDAGLRWLFQALTEPLIDPASRPPAFRLDAPEVVAVAEQMAALVEDEVVPRAGPLEMLSPAGAGQPIQTRGTAHVAQPIYEGRVAMWIGETGVGGMAKADIAAYPAPLPRTDLNLGIGPLASNAYYVAADTPHVDACWQWLRFLSEDVPPGKGLPARRSVLTSNAFREQVGADAQRAYLDALGREGLPVPRSLADLPIPYGSAYLWLDDALDQILWEGVAARTALDRAQAKADAYLACLWRSPTPEERSVAKACYERADAIE